MKVGHISICRGKGEKHPARVITNNPESVGRPRIGVLPPKTLSTRNAIELSQLITGYSVTRASEVPCEHPGKIGQGILVSDDLRSDAKKSGGLSRNGVVPLSIGLDLPAIRQIDGEASLSYFNAHVKKLWSESSDL